MKSKVTPNSSAALSNNLLKKRITNICNDNDLNNDIQTVIVRLFDYMMKKPLYGGCHALCSVLYVALSELNQKPRLLIGECEKMGEKPFDHSWIILNDKIIDLAIYMPLNQKINSYSGPVIMDIDATSLSKYAIKYGINTGLPIGNSANFAIDTPFKEYMNAFPYEKNGLWSVLQVVMPDSYEYNLSEIKTRYQDIERDFIR